jgi:GTP-binding protein
LCISLKFLNKSTKAITTKQTIQTIRSDYYIIIYIKNIKEIKIIMFGLDLIDLVVESGRGGNGAISEYRARYIPKGGPDGGDGGDGGSVYIKVDRNIFSFKHLLRNRIHKAKNGDNGKGQNKTGGKGKDVTIAVPPGTIIWDNTVSGEKYKIKDVTTMPEEFFCLLKGGRGGRGNSKLANSRKQFPNYAQIGGMGQKKKVVLELNIIADVAIIGVPNAGKSSLLAALTKATPEIADYPFTTKHPEIGIYEELKGTVVFLDIPGLLDGASRGVGMGVEFLRHISRVRCLVHVVDGLSTSQKQDVLEIQKEINEYSPSILKKPTILAVSKLDLINRDISKVTTLMKDLIPEENLCVFSSKSGEGLSALVSKIKRNLSTYRDSPNKTLPTEIKPTTRPNERKPSIFRDSEGNYTVRCGLNLKNTIVGEESLPRIWQILESEGICRELEEAGISDGDRVSIGHKVFVWGVK